jgi:circadian clock protein KaiC
MRTGIPGLDEALGGGLPRGRATLVVGSPGAGKTIFAVQTLAEGVRLGEAGVFLTFEESAKDLLANVAAFAWAPSGRARTRMSFMDAREVRTAFRNGSFDLVGLLSALDHRCRRTKARRIALDGLDVLLDMIDDPAVMRREVYRLSDWLSEHSLTAVITAKRSLDDEALPSRFAFLPFLTDCVIVLQHRIVDRTAERSLRILKCRGVAHSSNEMPLVLSSRSTQRGRKKWSTGSSRRGSRPALGGWIRCSTGAICGAPARSSPAPRGRPRPPWPEPLPRRPASGENAHSS